MKSQFCVRFMVTFLVKIWSIVVVVVVADKTSQILLQHLQRADIGVESLVRLLCQEKYNNKGLMMNFLGPVLSNLSQLPQVRKQILGR